MEAGRVMAVVKDGARLEEELAREKIVEIGS
jgi:hypothetical protein